MKEVKVTVIIPTYGGGTYLARAIDSVVKQTFKEIEIIVVDDNGLGSRNQITTSEIVKKYSKLTNFNYVCHEKNINGSAARNTGAKLAKGEYIALLDDDDEFYPDNIQRQYDILSKLTSDYGLTYCGFDLYRDNSLLDSVIPEIDGDVLFELLSHTIDMSSSMILIRKDVWEQVDGFDEEFRRHQDWEFLARVADKCKVKSVPFIGIRKYQEFRNSAKTPDQVKEYRDFYLSKMDPLIHKLPYKEQQIIYRRNNIDVALQYLKAHDFIKFFKIVFHSNIGLHGICIVFNRGCRYLKTKFK